MIASLFDDAATPDGAERFDAILTRPGIRIERIVSTGQTTPEGEPYDQSWDEWVLLIAGAARIALEGKGEFALTAGDHLLIPAHCRHHVLWTDPDRPTIWLAVHLDGEG